MRLLTDPAYSRIRNRTALLLLIFIGFGWGISLLEFVLSIIPYRYAPLFPDQAAIGTLDVDVFTSVQPLPFADASGAIFGGRLSELQLLAPRTAIVMNLQLAAFCILLLIVSLAAGRLDRRKPALIARAADWIYLSAVSVLSLMISIRLSQGWDETFINLKHSYNLLHHGLYSANAGERLEATVDLIPFAGTALVSAVTGLELIDIAIGISLFGTLLSLWIANRLVRDLSGSRLAGHLAAFCGVLPPLVFVGGSSFMAPLFTALILLAGHWYFVRRGRAAGRARLLLAALVLFRTEGVLLAGFVWAGEAAAALRQALRRRARPALWRRAARILALRFALLAAPFFLLSLGRWLYFGSALPVPMTYKNTSGDIYYLGIGLKQLFEMLGYFRFDILLIVTVPLLAWFVAVLGRRAQIYLAAVTLLCLIYFTGGGDWFPLSWARYTQPFMLLTGCLLIAGLFRAMHGIRPLAPVSGLASLAVIAVLCTAIGYARPGESAFTQMNISQSWDRWSRVNSLAIFGRFLKATTEETARIASPEMATIMYFAERDLVDLLGIANPLVAKAPLDPLLTDPGHHRRRAPEAVALQKPDVIALYEMAELLPTGVDTRSLPAIGASVRKLLFKPEMVDIAYYRIGSFDHLQKLGYKPVVVAAPGRIFFYWVAGPAWPEHRRRMEGIGLSALGTLKLDYDVRREIAQHFSSGDAP